MTDGEAWTCELLAELKAARYTPRAWGRFLARSFERAAEQRRARPRAHRQVVVLETVGLVAAAAVAGAGRPWLAVAAVGWWSTVVLMLDWHLGMLERPDGRALAALGLPNLLALARLAIVPFVVAVPEVAAAGLLLAAGASDALDGALARRRDQVTRLGFWLDGTADALLLSAAAVAALPLWAGALVLARYLLPWPALAAAYFVRAQAPSRDRFISGRVPGLVVLSGLILAFLDVAAGSLVAAVGAIGGLGTVSLNAVRSSATPRPAPR